jgi:hypothetical protein
MAGYQGAVRQIMYGEWLSAVLNFQQGIDSEYFPRYLRQFLHVTDDGFVFIKTMNQVSDMIDLSDFHPLEGKILTWVDGDFHDVSVKRGSTHHINTDEESPFRYAQSELVANGKVVGYVTHTDH